MRVVNLTTKRLEDFEAGDGLYVKKHIGEFDYFPLCKFIAIEKGLVKVEVVEVDYPYWPMKPGDVLKVRKDKCVLWGPRGNDEWLAGINRCHWYSKEKGWK